MDDRWDQSHYVLYISCACIGSPYLELRHQLVARSMRSCSRSLLVTEQQLLYLRPRCTPFRSRGHQVGSLTKRMNCLRVMLVSTVLVRLNSTRSRVNSCRRLASVVVVSSVVACTHQTSPTYLRQPASRAQIPTYIRAQWLSRNLSRKYCLCTGAFPDNR